MPPEGEHPAASSRLPDPDRVVVTPAHDPPAVPGESDAVDPSRMPLEREELAAGRGVPHSRRPIPTAGGHAPAIRGEGSRPNVPAPTPLKPEELAAGGRFPDPHAIATASDD